jgi:hypothetical protein
MPPDAAAIIERLVEGHVCLDAAPTPLVDGSTITEGTSHSIAVSSLTTSSSTLSFERLGLQAVVLGKKKRGKFGEISA